MYKQILERKKISPLVIILIIIACVFLAYAFSVLFTVLNAYIAPVYFDPTASTLSVFLIIFVIS